MSNDTKKPGTRDISDLKARLGLKKGGGAAADPGRATGSIVPPPGAAKIGGNYVPPPPGVAPPPGAAPPQPQLPDAREDPFGAMNAMAQQGAVQAAPQIVIVNDGKPVEQVSPAGNAARYAKIAGIILAPMILGFLLGGINQSRQNFNRTLDDAKALDTEFVGMSKELENLNLILGNAKDRGNGKYVLNDKQLVDDMSNLKLNVADDEKLILYHSYLFHMNAKLRQDLLTFYSKVKTLSTKVKEHVQLSQATFDKMSPEAFHKLAPSFPDFPASNTLFGAIVRTPTADQAAKGAKPAMEVVEIGYWACANGDAPTAADDKTPPACADGKPIAGLKFRSSPEQMAWGSKAFTLDPMVPSTAADQILPLVPNDVWKSLLQGSQRFIDDEEYMKRIGDIDKLTDEVRKERFDIENRLKTLASESHSFAL